VITRRALVHAVGLATATLVLPELVLAAERSLLELAADASWFRQRFIAIAKEIHPGEKIEPERGRDDSVRMRGVSVGLANARADFLHSNGTDATLREIVRRYSSLAFSEPSGIADASEARPRLRPVLVPREYDRMLDLIFPFSRGLRLAIVLDEPERMRYLTAKELTTLELERGAVVDVAIENLYKASADLSLQMSTKKGSEFIICAMDDGYAAARILVPGLRQHFGKRLGFPYYCGIPNRDFLVCWSSSNDRDVHDGLSKQVRADYGEQPHPLSGDVFRVTDKDSRPAEV
jgi:uncharacterized protein YtpQ (UPF0354 family)